MPGIDDNQLIDENLNLIHSRRNFLEQLHLKPELFWPFLRPCEVKLLIVVDGLDFSDANFGLSTFVRSLLDMPGLYVRFKITLAHIGAASATQMLDGEPRIVRRIAPIRFDDPDHFAPGLYDEVMLFGIAVEFPGRGKASNGELYPADRLADPELRALTEFMNGGGGLFATGDHGALGRFLCHAVPRARNMRLWQSTSAQDELDEVSMGEERRNDTNRIGGSAGSQFDDQSDDVPQDIQPRMYRRTTGLFRFTFPHPLLCGPQGVIRVMPDHPHEGECLEPGDTSLQLDFGGPLGPEYPDAIGGGVRPLPEVISTSTVLSGTTSGGKRPTLAQSFGGICAYDGHRAGIGRVVTDATWHHFVNINLVGNLEAGPMDPKRLGFLTPAGQAHLEEIKAYYRNLAVWLAPPARIFCMNTRLSWHLIWTDRVMEAVLSTTDIRLTKVQPYILKLIGQHARDVLGRFAGRCQSVRIVLDLVWQRALPDLIPDIDPWLPDPPRRRQAQDDIEWFDGTPLLDISFGAALVALREAFPHPDERVVAGIESEKLAEILAEGGRVGIELAVKSATTAASATRARLKI
jgi:hypothetical protein